jgi:hypothetical protein
MARQRLLVLKGGGGEAERVPLKPAIAHLWDSTRGVSEIALPGTTNIDPPSPKADTPELLKAVWEGEAEPPTAIATITATIGLGLIAIGRDPGEADIVWRQAARAGRLGAGVS